MSPESINEAPKMKQLGIFVSIPRLQPLSMLTVFVSNLNEVPLQFDCVLKDLTVCP